MKPAPIHTVPHVMPDEIGGDISWFYRQSPFEQDEIRRQVQFKRRKWPELTNGRLARRPEHTYPHILPIGDEPDEHAEKAFYPPLYLPVKSEFEQWDIALHSEALNLKSSQVACLNFLFPFKLDLALAAQILTPILPGLQSVSRIEFEYAGIKVEDCPDAYGRETTVEWLGEPGSGKRGQNRTSIDAAIFWNDSAGRRRVTLIEWKYTEHNFGVCSAYHSASAAEKAGCDEMRIAVEPNPGEHCLLTTGARHRNRRYWEHLEAAGISPVAFAGVQGCPFQGPFYQLMRQFLLGYHLKLAGIVDEYEVSAMSFDRNDALRQLPAQLRPLVATPNETVIDAWNHVLVGAPQLRHISVDQWMKKVEGVQGVDPEWRVYIRERYGV